jgi:hypothetical protein
LRHQDLSGDAARPVPRGTVAGDRAGCCSTDAGRLSSAVGTAELQALKNGDLDSLVLFSPTIDRAVVEGYGFITRLAATSRRPRNSAA